MASAGGRDGESGSTIRRRLLLVTGGFVLVAVVGAGVWFTLGQGTELSPRTDAAAVPLTADVSVDPRFDAASDASEGAMSPSMPGELELPEVDSVEASSVEGLLKGDGVALVEFLVASEGLWDQVPLDDTACESVRERFEAIASPPELVSLARDLDDTPASDVLASLVSVAALVVSDCGANEENVSEMAWHWAVAYRRLAELGVDIP